ncbi:MAG: hypothetical protein RI953_2998 [Pseudomonadota bacterium]|jgi:magnesium chelatase family protein
MSCIVYSAVCLGLQIVPVTIEAALGSGFSGVQLIGLPQDYAREARERIRAALENLGLTLPARRLVVSVRPVETLKQFKVGLEHLDLPCAIAIIAALAEQRNGNPKETEKLISVSRAVRTGKNIFAGQLTLSGHLLPPEQALPFELLVIQQHSEPPTIYSPISSNKITLAPPTNFIYVESLQDCLQKITSTSKSNPPQEYKETRINDLHQSAQTNHRHHEDRSKRIESTFKLFLHTPVFALALALAAAGRHHILLAGSPGCGKTFALKKLRELLPPMNNTEALEAALIHQRGPTELTFRPFRNPHHSASAAALLGGSLLLPGEVTLAHHGLLFLDELAEFPRPALEALREPLDEKKITLSRSRGRVELPANFMLASATNPCPCGFFFSRHQSCRCLGTAPIKYQQKLSGPLLERFSILLLADEQANFTGDSTEEKSTLFELAMHWKKHFEQDPSDWVKHFVEVQNMLWNPKSGSRFSAPETEFAKALESHSSSLMLSQRTKRRLQELLASMTALFPDAAENWPKEKFLSAAQQLRGLEGALRKGVSFLTPTASHSALKDLTKQNDIL